MKLGLTHCALSFLHVNEASDIRLTHCELPPVRIRDKIIREGCMACHDGQRGRKTDNLEDGLELNHLEVDVLGDEEDVISNALWAGSMEWKTRTVPEQDNQKQNQDITRTEQPETEQNQNQDQDEHTKDRTRITQRSTTIYSTRRGLSLFVYSSDYNFRIFGNYKEYSVIAYYSPI